MLVHRAPEDGPYSSKKGEEGAAMLAGLLAPMMLTEDLLTWKRPTANDLLPVKAQS